MKISIYIRLFAQYVLIPSLILCVSYGIYLFLSMEVKYSLISFLRLHKIYTAIFVFLIILEVLYIIFGINFDNKVQQELEQIFDELPEEVKLQQKYLTEQNKQDKKTW